MCAQTTRRESSGPLATSEEVAAAAATALQHGRIGIDTEFMSEGRYRALLCLVQIAVDDPASGQTAGGVHILLIDSLDDVDVTPVAPLLADPAIEVVLHAGRQDVAILRRAWQTEITNIFDTQLAAGFVGAGAQTGYGNLLGTMLGRRVGKTASYTRWDARPLTAEQLSYAAEDVAHLLELADEVQRRLRETGRESWAREECRRLESATDERDPYTAWERLPRVGQLDPRARAVARELAAWRERTAAEEDRPVGSVLADPALVELAKRHPSNLSALEHIRGIHPSGIRRRGPAILDAIAEGTEGAADSARRAARPLGPRGCAVDRARRGAAAGARARSRARLRADRLAQRARADRRRHPARRPRAGRAHARGLALGACRRRPTRSARRPPRGLGRAAPAVQLLSR